MSDLPSIRSRAAEFQRLQDAATPGPWELGDGENDHEIISKRLGLMVACCINSWLPECVGNAHFIAHVRNTTLAADVLALCEEVERNG